MIKGIFAALLTLCLVVFIIYLSYVVTKQIAKGHMGRSVSKYMKLCDQLTIGQDKSVAVVQVGDRYFLVGIASNQVNLLTEVEEEGLIALPPDRPVSFNNGVPFKDIMDKVGEKLKKR